MLHLLPKFMLLER